MRKIVIHEVNVHIGGPPPADGSRKAKRKKARTRRAGAEERDRFEQDVSERTASHVEAGQDDLATDYGSAVSLGTAMAIPNFWGLTEAAEEDGENEESEDESGAGAPSDVDEFSPGLPGDVTASLDGPAVASSDPRRTPQGA